MWKAGTFEKNKDGSGNLAKNNELITLKDNDSEVTQLYNRTLSLGSESQNLVQFFFAELGIIEWSMV